MYMKNFLNDAYDLHVHTYPDIKQRKMNDIQIIERMRDKGMRGVVIKSHFFETATRAKLMEFLYPDFEIYGGVCLNNSMGGINPEIVEKTAQVGGKFVWFPTMDSLSYRKSKNKNIENEEKYIYILNSHGKLHDNVEDVLDVIKSYKLVLCTGHLSSKEGLELIKRASEKRIKKIIVTHADNPANYYNIAEQKKAVQLGAIIEHCYYNILYKQSDIKEIANQIIEIGAKNIVLSSDLGQINSPYNDQGLINFAKNLVDNGINFNDIKEMLSINPRLILNGE